MIELSQSELEDLKYFQALEEKAKNRAPEWWEPMKGSDGLPEWEFETNEEALRIMRQLWNELFNMMSGIPEFGHERK